MEFVAVINFQIGVEAAFNLVLADKARWSFEALASATGDGESNFQSTTWQPIGGDAAAAAAAVATDGTSSSSSSSSSGAAFAFADVPYSHWRRSSYLKQINEIIGPKETNVLQVHGYYLRCCPHHKHSQCRILYIYG